MSIKDSLKEMAQFMDRNPSYRPSRITVSGTPEYVLSVLVKNGISQTLTLRGVPLECVSKPAPKK